MNDRSRRVFVYRGNLPLWLVFLFVLPLGAVFLTSLILALLIAGAGTVLAAFILPLFWKRVGAPPTDAKTIDLDPSQYRRLDTHD